MDEEFLRKLERQLADDGKLIEAGWVGLQIAAIPPGAPQIQLDEMRMSFFAGAQHLFSSIMSILDPGEEETEDDLRRMDLISDELEAFITEFAAKHGLPPMGKPG
jgi:hypothetical protein